MLWVLLKTHFTEIFPQTEIVEFYLEKVLLTSKTEEQISTAPGMDKMRTGKHS